VYLSRILIWRFPLLESQVRRYQSTYSSYLLMVSPESSSRPADDKTAELIDARSAPQLRPLGLSEAVWTPVMTRLPHEARSITPLSMLRIV
jgi:hypothetical protein